MVMSFALLFAFIFFVFLWLGFRRFSFTEVVFGIEPVVPWPQSGIDSVGSVGRLTEDDGGLARGGRHEEGEETNAEGHPLKEDSAGSMERRCAEIAEVFGLTERESEILGMLARGRNARFIMEEFVLSRNTVKSHIKHIYSKLGVHSQQELIDIAEGK